MEGIDSPFSSCFYDKSPPKSKDPAKQRKFVEDSNKILQASVVLIKDGLSSGTEPSDIFFKSLALITSARSVIAHENAQENAENFGLARFTDNQERSSFLPNFTFISGMQTKHHADQFLKQLASVTSSMKHTKFEFPEAKLKKTGKISEKSHSYEVSILHATSIKKSPTHEQISELLGEKVGEEVGRSKQHMSTLKTKFPVVYTGMKTHMLLSTLRERFPSRESDTSIIPDNLKSGFIVNKIRVEVGGAKFLLGSHFTWYYFNHTQDPIERMRERSKVIVTHQDPFLIEDTLKEIANLFGRIITWNPEKESLNVLKDRVILLRFMYAYSMPHVRGDGAVGDILELAIYHLHGFTQTHHNSKTVPCYVPLASLSAAHYKLTYDKTITIAKPEAGGEASADVEDAGGGAVAGAATPVSTFSK